jgi:uncharacterized repeat protein (TIGR02543 family)
MGSNDPASVFAGWSGACTGTAPCTITMSNSATINLQATFNKQ